MRMTGIIILLILFGAREVLSDEIVASRTIRSQTILSPADLILVENDNPGAFTSIDELVGMETRFVIYQGRAINGSDVGPAAIIERNQTVTLLYIRGPLSISADGRSLGRAGVGERVKVMNLTSRTTVFGLVAENGDVIVGSSAARNSR